MPIGTNLHLSRLTLHSNAVILFLNYCTFQVHDAAYVRVEGFKDGKHASSSHRLLYNFLCSDDGEIYHK